MAKKNNPQDEQIEEMLHRVLGQYQEILFKAANAQKDEDLYSYKQRFLRTMETGSNALKTAAKSVVDKYIPNIDTPVSTLLQSFGARYGGEEIKLTTYVRMVDMLTGSVEQYRLRIDEKIRDRERQGKVTTVMDLQDIINQDLRDDNVTVVRYANGTSVPVDKYAAMLARTTRAETENLSMIQQALREGIDLVECDIVSPTCDSCAVYQGRVYSISGNDSRYPALYKTAFKSGYSIIHPNCRHSWSPYHVELYSEEERRQALERSNRTWKPDGDGRVFQQTERARAEYSKGQQLMRQWNAEIVEYERMKAYYAEQGQEPPYKSLGAFRREARKPREKQSDVFRSMRSRIAEANRGDISLDRAIPLKQERIKGVQYEAKFAQSVPTSAVHTVAVKSRQILRENNRKKEETAVCVSLGTGEVLLEQHAKGLVMEVDTSKLRGQPADSVIMTHNHPTGTSFSERDLEFMGNNPQIHTMIAVSPDGKVFSLRTNCGKTVDRYIVSEYNRNIRAGLTREETLQAMAKKYGWEYKEL